MSPMYKLSLHMSEKQSNFSNRRILREVVSSIKVSQNAKVYEKRPNTICRSLAQVDGSFNGTASIHWTKFDKQETS